ncbi:MAG: co-chaperone GroES [Candidatus Babeliales bacterium]|nr:co-chaperone GroES [Candidatus Babeliales bacterium]
MFQKIKPLYDKVLIQRVEDETKTAGGLLYIPDVAKERAQTGKVIAAGAGRLTPDGKVLPLQVKVGDTVYFGKYAGTQAGDDFLIIKEDEILGIIEL